MMQRYRKDLNESAIVETAEHLGASCIKMEGSAGFDRLVICPRGVFVVEIKNPAEAWRLTANELKTRANIEAAGGAYYIVETEAEIIGLICGEENHILALLEKDDHK